MSATLIGYGVPDYKHFALGAPVLVMTSRSENPANADVPYAGRLRDQFCPGLALLMREGPFATNLQLRQKQVVHWITERRYVHEAPEAFHLVIDDRSTALKRVSVMLDRYGFVDGFETRTWPLVWPEHLGIAERIKAKFSEAYAMHGQTVESLLYR